MDQPALDMDVYRNPPDVDRLELEPVHPGIGDEAYVAAATSSFPCAGRPGSAVSLRRSSTTPTTRSASGARCRRSSTSCTGATRATSISSAKRELEDQRRPHPAAAPSQRAPAGAVSGMHLVPAEGPDSRTGSSTPTSPTAAFRCTQFIRHGSKPEFTPEPDMIHDCLGHVPPLLNHDYAALLTLIGRAAVRADVGRPRPRAEAAQLVLDRVRADRGGRRDAGLRRRHPLVDRRDSRSRCRRTSSGGRSSPTRSSRPTTTGRRCRNCSS